MLTSMSPTDGRGRNTSTEMWGAIKWCDNLCTWALHPRPEGVWDTRRLAGETNGRNGALYEKGSRKLLRSASSSHAYSWWQGSEHWSHSSRLNFPPMFCNFLPSESYFSGKEPFASLLQLGHRLAGSVDGRVGNMLLGLLFGRQRWYEEGRITWRWHRAEGCSILEARHRLNGVSPAQKHGEATCTRRQRVCFPG